MKWKTLKTKMKKVEPYTLIGFGLFLAGEAYHNLGFSRMGMYGICLGMGFIISGIVLKYITDEIDTLKRR